MPASTYDGTGDTGSAKEIPHSAEETNACGEPSTSRHTLFSRFRRRSSGGENLKQAGVPETAEREETAKKEDVPVRPVSAGCSQRSLSWNWHCSHKT